MGKDNKSSLFITFEGPEGAGKSTQIRALAERLARLGIQAVATLEPGGTGLGNRVRQLVKDADGVSISSKAELFLFAASRAQLVDEIIGPHLAMGDVVICDRYAESTMAYQGYGRGLSIDTINTINGIATSGVVPNLIVLLDLPVEIGLKRKGQERDRFQEEDLVFHQKVRKGYLQMAAGDPGRWLAVDGTLPQGKVTEVIWERVSTLLGLPAGVDMA